MDLDNLDKEGCDDLPDDIMSQNEFSFTSIVRESEAAFFRRCLEYVASGKLSTSIEFQQRVRDAFLSDSEPHKELHDAAYAEMKRVLASEYICGAQYEGFLIHTISADEYIGCVEYIIQTDIELSQIYFD